MWWGLQAVDVLCRVMTRPHLKRTAALLIVHLAGRVLEVQAAVAAHQLVALLILVRLLHNRLVDAVMVAGGLQ